LVQPIINHAIKGNSACMKEIVDSVDGKVKEAEFSKSDVEEALVEIAKEDAVVFNIINNLGDRRDTS